MPKSKEIVSSSDEESSSGSEAPKPKKRKAEESSKKAEKKSDSGKSKAVAKEYEKGPNGELMFQLARGMRYATVSEFRGKVLVSIREYYEKDGDMRPGKKGISLTLEQWNALKDQMDDIETAIRKF